MRRRNEILSVLLFFAAFYAVTLLYFYIQQRQLIYFPDKTVPDKMLFGAQDMDVITVETDDGLTLQGWYKAPSGKKKPVVVLFHGNAGHIGIRAFKAQMFLAKGYGFLLAGYRGYGGNPGAISEQGLYSDGRAYIDWLERNGIPPENTVLCGESLGTGVAVEMAIAYPDVKAVILESPYTALPEIAQKHLFWLPAKMFMKDRFDSLQKMKGIKAPLLVVHGRLDRIVPYRLGQQLYDAANEPKTMETFPFAGHNDLYAHGAGKAVIKFLEYIEKQ